MNLTERETILSRLQPAEFFGRKAEMDRFCQLVGRRYPGSGAVVLAGPRAGKTEFLTACFDRLFQESGAVAPVYYCFSRDRLDASLLAQDILSAFLSQFIAFRRGDANLIGPAANGFESAATLGLSEDYFWAARLVEKCSQFLAKSDGLSALRTVLSAPAIAGHNTAITPLVLLDDLHHLKSAEPAVRAEFIASIITRSAASSAAEGNEGIPVYVLSGLRRVLLEMSPPDEEFFDGLEAIRLEPLPEKQFEEMIASLTGKYGVAISDSTCELMIQQLGRDLFYTRSLVSAAASGGCSLKTFMEFERCYTEEVLNGRIGHYLDAVLREAAPRPAERRAALEVLALLSTSESEIPLGSVVQRTGLSPGEAEKLLGRLHDRELLEISLGFVRKQNDPVFLDYVRARYKNWIAGAPKPLSGSELLGEKLKYSYRLMMSRYNRAIESQLVELLSRFDFQSAPLCLFDARAYDLKYEGMSRIQVSRALDDEQDRIRLPQVVTVSELGSGEIPGASFKIFGAFGFEGGVYSEANEVGWFTALVNSKEPLELAALEIILKRVELLVRSRGRLLPASARQPIQPRNVKWILSKEGFTRAASDRIAELSAYQSTFDQFDLACGYLLKVADQDSEAQRGSEFELVIPIEDDAELIAARTIEQIARTADFDQESINQVKTALIEACINAAEHSDSPDRRIYLKFNLTDEGLFITVSSKGKQFSRPETELAGVGSPRRGRGLHIIKALMDEARFERTDDGSTLVMAKFFRRPESRP